MILDRRLRELSFSCADFERISTVAELVLKEI